MDPEERTERLEQFQRLCREQRSPRTPTRVAILEAVLASDGHPTADDIHAAVVDRVASVSRTTVYRALETLDRMGVITKLCHPGRVVRYDARTEVHHHLVCLRCDRVVDIDDPGLDAVPIPDTSSYGFEVVDHRVQLRGLCRRCREQEESS